MLTLIHRAAKIPADVSAKELAELAGGSVGLSIGSAVRAHYEFSENSAQLKEHPPMPGCASRPADLDRPEYGVGNKRKYRIARGL